MYICICSNELPRKIYHRFLPINKRKFFEIELMIPCCFQASTVDVKDNKMQKLTRRKPSEDKREAVCIIQMKLKVELLFSYLSDANLF